MTGVSAELRAILLNIICKILQILCRFVNSAHDAQFCMRWPSVQNSVCAEFWQTYLHCLTACGFLWPLQCTAICTSHSLSHSNSWALTSVWKHCMPHIITVSYANSTNIGLLQHTAVCSTGIRNEMKFDRFTYTLFIQLVHWPLTFHDYFYVWI